MNHVYCSHCDRGLTDSEIDDCYRENDGAYFVCNECYTDDYDAWDDGDRWYSEMDENAYYEGTDEYYGEL